MAFAAHRSSGRSSLAWLAPLVVLAALLAAWELWVRVSDQPAWFLPAPSLIGRTLWNDRGIIASDAWVTLQEVLIGFGIAVVAGCLAALLIDSSKTVERAIYPIVIATQAVPIVALAPLLLIWFGHGLLPKVIITALVAFFPIAVATADGLKSADRETLNLFRTMGATSAQRFRFVKAPSALPSFFSGARIGAAVAVIGAVIGEFAGSDAGLGHLITLSSANLRTDRVFASVAVLAVMSIALFGTIALVERLAMPWRRYVTATAEE